MSRAEERIRGFESRHPAAVRLAEAVSLAVLADPPLLRKARRDLVPGADPGTEADLWLSPLVQTRSPDGLVFAPDVAEALRARLAMEPDRLDRAWRITQAMHRHLTPALRLEEEIAWLAVSPDPQAAARIEELLRSVLAALVGERRGLAHWAARALPKLPSRVRVSEAARMLEIGARLRLRGDARSLQGEEGLPGWLSAVAPADLRRTPVAVRLFEGAVEIDAQPGAEGRTLQLPETDPLLVELSWDATGGGRQAVQVTLRKGEVQRIAVPVQDVRLRTVLGEVYDLRKAGTAPRGLQDWILDFSEERARHRPFFGRIEEQEQIQQALRAASLELLPGAGRLILVTGEVGAGKSALLAHVIDRLKEQDLEPPHHFFRRGRARLEDVAVAEKSLIAQIARRFPEVALKARHLRLPALLEELLDRKLLSHETQPLILVLDAVDEAEANEGQRDNALLEILPAELPDHVVVLASAQAGREEGLRLPGPILHVRLTEAGSALQELWLHHGRRLPELAEGIGPFVAWAQGSFGIARVLLSAWQRWTGLWGDQREQDGLTWMWGVLERRLGHDAVRLWFGTLSAAFEPLPSALVYEITQEQRFQAILSPVVSFHETAGEAVYDLREEVLRTFAVPGLDLREHHRRLAEVSTAAIFDDTFSHLSRRYGLHHAADHWIAAGDMESALGLLTRADVLKMRCREIGVAAVRRGLLRWLRAAIIAALKLDFDREAALPHPMREVRDLWTALTAIAPQIESRPEELFSLLYNELRLRSWEPETIQEFLQLPAGTPALRLANPFPPDGPRRRPPVRHRDEIVGCAFVDLNGPAVLSWSTDGSLRIWDMGKGELRTALVGHEAAVTGCALLERGRIVSASRDGTLRIWNTREGSLVRTLWGHEGEVLGVLALDSGFAVSWSTDRTIRIWNLTEGREVRVLRGHEGTVTACTVNQDWIISGSEDTTVRVWDISTGRLISSHHRHRGAVTGVAAQEGQGVIVSVSQDRWVCAWSLDGAVEETFFEGHTLGILGCAFSPTEDCLATWSLDRTVRLWRVFPYIGEVEQGDPMPSGKLITSPLSSLVGHEGAILNCVFNAAGDLLVSCSADRTVRVWDVETGELLAILNGHEAPVRAVAFDSRIEHFNGRWQEVYEGIVSVAGDRTVRVWDLREYREAAVLDGAHETLLCLSTWNRSRVVTVSRLGEVSLHQVGAPSPGRIGSLSMRVGGGVMTLSDRVILWPRHRGEEGMSLAIINLSTGQVDEFGFGHEDPIVKLVVTYDERGISVGRDGLIQVWELDEEHFPLGAFRTKAPFSDLSVSSDVRRILASSWDKTLWLFSGDLRLQARLTGHTDRVLACAIAPDGRRAISAAADRTLRIWDLETGSALSILTGHTADVTGCAFTGDGRRIVSRSKDGRIGLWDGGSGSLVAFTTGHTDWVNAFALAEEEGVVYSCSEDQTVRAWDLVTGEPRGVVYGVSPFRSLAAVAGGVYAGDEAGNLWILEYGEGLRRAVA